MSYVDRSSDFEQPGRRALRRLKCGLSEFHLPNGIRAMMKVFLARFSHMQFTGSAVDQARPQPFFQSSEFGADRRLGHI